MRVFGHMTRDIISIKPSTSIKKAYEIMQEEKLRHLVIVEHSKLLGIISDRDIYREGNMQFGKFHCSDRPVKEFMSTDIITCLPSTTIGEASRLLIDNKIDCLPVTQFSKLVGLITSTDLLEILCTDAPVSLHAPIPISYNLRAYATN
ncbi:MAG: CBS domain-containing protein [Bdellovibrionota bacterium]